MFKNLTVYRIGPEWSATLEQIEEALSKARFVECGASQPQSVGWVEPRGVDHGPLVESIGGQLLLRLKIEQKVLPGSVVKRRTDEMAQQIEQTTGRKPGKKQTKEIKEQAVLELLPMAFTKISAINVWIDPVNRFLMLDTSSSTKAEEVITLLVKSLDGFAVSQLHTAESPAVAMSDWLLNGEPPAAFTVDRECELKSADEMKSVVRYSRHPLDNDDVRQHINVGKVPTRLAMTWEGRVSFLLTDMMQLKKLDFLDVVFEGRQMDNPDEAFDANAAIATGEMSKLIPDLIEALGGEETAPF
ncbi:recombination-associated protein RdgC [Caldimonas brevitalea]|uniref:Recombination-associated protein RdgC n=1 Tax=Caldimonas brevitalea TaxID=413882 RepID=A0A0G3BMK3_9BURK|nr:recombination-associated protein RdgC [Caldimonas brevitalea]AKJ28596.1 exonuclease [Caldimonas brevitalea]